MSRLLDNLREFYRSIPRSERLWVAGAMAVSFALVLAYVIANHPNSLAGDQREYHDMGKFFTEGKPWWGFLPSGMAHESAYRPPAYPLWTGFWYSLLGTGSIRVLLVQTLLAPLTVLLTWGLARRLFGARAAIATAWLVAVFPFVWMWFGLLYTEALAIPLMVVILMVLLERAPTTRLALGLGALVGVAMLIRPTSAFVFAGVLAAFVLAVGWRRGAALTAISVGIAALVIVPWTIRNYVVTDELVVLSVQDAALHGTFNETSANDPENPYSWRPSTPEVEALEADPEPLTDVRYRDELVEMGLEYISDHPFSVVEALYWNGIRRFWDIRSPNRALDEVQYEGRSDALTKIGLGMHYLLLPLAAFGLWRHRRRRGFVIPVLALAVAATLVFTIASGTRYRAPLEPLIAMSAVIAFVQPRREADETPPASPAPSASGAA